jgi:hypothetical protein
LLDRPLSKNMGEPGNLGALLRDGVKARTKVSRNDSCSCGSGKKYKKHGLGRTAT